MVEYREKILKVLAEIKGSGDNYVSFPAIAYKVVPELRQIEEEIVSMGRLDRILPSGILTEEDKHLARVIYIDTPKIRQERRKLSAKRRAILISVLHNLWNLVEEGYLKVTSCHGDLLTDESDMVYSWYITDKVKEVRQ
jgi:hypothetical protein